MISFKKLALHLILVSACILAGCASDSTTQPKNIIPPTVEKTAQDLTADLTAQGFQVSRGYFRLYTQEDCDYSYATMNTCYGNNPASPYIIFAVPPWPEEYQDPATTQTFGKMDPGYRGTFRLDPREALVIFGVMPPPAAYFGLQTYLFSREGTFDTTSAAYQYIATNYPLMLSTYFTSVPANQKRLQVFASLSNSNNNVVFDRQSGASFSQERYFVISPDKIMDGTVRASLGKLAVNASNIVSEPIPSTMRLGLGESADEFMSLMRYAMPADENAAELWRSQLPLVVLRVRDTRKDRAVQPYPPVVLDTRIAVNESQFTASLASLVAEVSSRWGVPCTKADCSDRATAFVDLQSPPFSLVGPDCTEIGMNCLGDTQDTTYHVSKDALSVSNGEVYAIAGTLATETGNATYTGLSVNDTILKKGMANVNSMQLKNSALGYAGTVSNADKLYLYYFARDCSTIQGLTGGNCVTITESMIPHCTVKGSPLCDYLKIVQRNYIKPGTVRAPDPLQTVSPITIKLR